MRPQLAGLPAAEQLNLDRPPLGPPARHESDFPGTPLTSADRGPGGTPSGERYGAVAATTGGDLTWTTAFAAAMVLVRALAAAAFRRLVQAPLRRLSISASGVRRLCDSS
jgi:hypothetical protein